MSRPIVRDEIDRKEPHLQHSSTSRQMCNHIHLHFVSVVPTAVTSRQLTYLPNHLLKHKSSTTWQLSYSNQPNRCCIISQIAWCGIRVSYSCRFGRSAVHHVNESLYTCSVTASQSVDVVELLVYFQHFCHNHGHIVCWIQTCTDQSIWTSSEQAGTLL